MFSTAYLYERVVITCIKTVNKKIQGKISIIENIGVGTGSDQWNRKKTSTKRVQQVK